jgi:hypothetical protein
MRLVYNHIIKRYAFGLYKPVNSKSGAEKYRAVKEAVKSSKLKRSTPTSTINLAKESESNKNKPINETDTNEDIPEEVKDDKEWHADYKVRVYY